MRFRTIIALGALLSSAFGVRCAAAQVAQPAPCNGCQSCQGAPCGCAGHTSDCCCGGICKQAPPNPLDVGRPSPPPCCADGYCYPNYQTWGHYGTRWRRWPIELAAARPAGVPEPGALGPDVRPYETPPPEEEDRRAPPPSAPRGEPVQIAPRTAPQEGQEQAPPEERTAPPEGEEPPPSPESIFDLPTEATPPGLPPLPTPTEETPTTTPLAPPSDGTSLPLDEPMGDLDPPPAPPFATRQWNGAPARRSAIRPATPSPKREIRPVAPQDDPAPELPSTLASVSR
jgi:hypothetical protein